MIEVQKKQNLENLLNDLAEEISVPESKYDEAKEHYEAVGNWLQDSLILNKYDVKIYPQGSFMLGTAIKPITKEDEYDIDAVCLLEAEKTEITPALLKSLVGNRLKENKTYEEMLDPKEGGRRCWTIKYSDASKFHLDILPAIPDDIHYIIQHQNNKYAKNSICITEKINEVVSSDWNKSNPKGYADWFNDRMKDVYEKYRKDYSVRNKMEIEKVPNYKIKTPLQKAIQLLKRHRDLKYMGDDDKPISIIITTLAALAYENESTLFNTLENIIVKMSQFIIKDNNGVYWIKNPVNPEENFADKWKETPRKAEIFYEWLNSLKSFFAEIVQNTDEEAIIESFENSYGFSETRKILSNYASNPIKKQQLPQSFITIASKVNNLFDVKHKLPMPWPLKQAYKVEVSATYQYKTKTFNYFNDGAQVPKDSTLKFMVKTNAPKPYKVRWQVVNTGKEAEKVGCLRGDFELPNWPDDNTSRKEETSYRGRHWVQAFILDENNSCIGKSTPFIVNIR